MSFSLLYVYSYPEISINLETYNNKCKKSLLILSDYQKYRIKSSKKYIIY